MTQWSRATTMYGMYLAIGADTYLAEHGGQRDATAEDSEKFEELIGFFGGHTGVMQVLAQYALVIAAMTKAAENSDWPGVFEYEVCEPFGAWWAEHMLNQPTPKKLHSACIETLASMISYFFYPRSQNDAARKLMEDAAEREKLRRKLSTMHFPSPDY